MRSLQRMAICVKTAEGGRWIIPQILEARRRGITVVAIIPSGDGRLARTLLELEAEDVGISVVRSAFDFRFRPTLKCIRDLRDFRKQIQKAHVQVILYHLYATALAVRLATYLSTIKRIHMVAGPLYLESPVIRIVETVLSRADTVIICGSEYTRKKYRDIHYPDSKLRVVPYGVDTSRFKPRARVVKPGAGLHVIMVAYVYAPKKLAFAGRGIKGHEELLQAWMRFHHRNPTATLTLVGSGFDQAGETYRRQLMSTLPPDPGAVGVKWLTSVEDVRGLYETADVSVSPSLSENHGAALEASAMGVPCIVSDAGALPEAVTVDTGWVHRAGDSAAIEDALERALAAKVEGSLLKKAAAARRLMELSFDQSHSAVIVMDIVEKSVQKDGNLE